MTALRSEPPAPLAMDMSRTCEHADHMSRTVQIRNVPDALHRKLKARALDSGQTLSDYLLTELERLAARPTREEMLDSTRVHVVAARKSERNRAIFASADDV
jgi:hypothetical protein